MDLNTGVTIASTIISSGAVGYIYKSAVRLEVLERLFEEKKTAVDTLKSSHDNMDKRLALVEQAVVGLNECLPEMRKFGQVAERLALLVEMGNKRLDNLEEKAAQK
jgi:hypothetical protein